jgi:hypothetical protein
MKYKLRIVNLSGGECRIQKRHWLLTLGFWVTLTHSYGTVYWQGSKRNAETHISDYYNKFNDNKIIGYEEVK